MHSVSLVIPVIPIACVVLAVAVAIHFWKGRA